jgi:peptidoglycan/xylan/chitin deacetylase (PgdA/CDA1 family)
VVALTFDDGPDPDGTPMVLDALARAGARATFFVLGERVEREPALLERVLGAGHDVQVHGYGHLRHPEHAREVIERDLEAALAALHGHGVTPTLWRLPYGEPAAFSAELAERHRLRLVRWTVDSYDWRGDRAPDMLTALEPELRENAIVLMHDGAGCARETAALIGPLVEAVRAKRLEPGAGSAWETANPSGVGARQAMDSGGGARGGVGGAGRGACRE